VCGGEEGREKKRGRAFQYITVLELAVFSKYLFNITRRTFVVMEDNYPFLNG
jgi:hypothetical protein